MSAGALTQRVQLLRCDQAVTTSGSGAVLEQFTRVSTVWAHVEPVRGGERWASDQRYADVTHRFRIRFRSDVAIDWQLEWQGQRFAVAEILPAGHQLREWLDIMATASPAENQRA